MRADLERHDGWVIVDAGEMVGFVVVDRRSPQAAEILWIAVEPTRRDTGCGTRCIDEFPDWPPGNPAAIYVAALETTS